MRRSAAGAGWDGSIDSRGEASGVRAIEDRESSAETVQWRSTVSRLGRVASGIGLVLVVNVVVLAIAIPLGVYLHRLVETVGLAEAGLLVACLVAAVTATVRRRRGLGLGLLAGWATGYVGLIIAIVTFVVAVVVIAIVIFVLWWLFLLLLGLISGIGHVAG
jgi:hypothetical protein